MDSGVPLQLVVALVLPADVASLFLLRCLLARVLLLDNGCIDNRVVCYNEKRHSLEQPLRRRYRTAATDAKVGVTAVDYA